MRILDRYILRQFLQNYLILLVVLTSMTVLVDSLIDPDDLLSAGRERASQFGGVGLATIYTLYDYYYPLTIMIFVFICGLVAVAAAGFTFNALSRTGELVAMITGGLSLQRIAAPVIVATAALSLATLPIQEFVIPPLAGKLARGKSEAAMESVSQFALNFAPDGDGHLFTAGRCDPARGTLENLTVLQREPGGRAARRITAPSARWNRDSGGWVLTEGQVRQMKVEPDRLQLEQLPAQPISFLPTDLSPDVMLARQKPVYLRLLSLNHLLRLENNPAADVSSIARIINSRLSTVAVNVILVVLALSVFLGREPGNPMERSVKAALLCIPAWGGSILVSQSQLPINAVTNAWLPVIVLLPLAAWMVSRIKT